MNPQAKGTRPGSWPLLPILRNRRISVYSRRSRDERRNIRTKWEIYRQKGIPLNHRLELHHLEKERKDTKMFGPLACRPPESTAMDDVSDRCTTTDKDGAAPENDTSKPEVPQCLPDRHYLVDDARELAQYMAAASYIVSLAGPPAPDIQYGVILLQCGTEELFFSQRDEGLSTRERQRLCTQGRRAALDFQDPTVKSRGTFSLLGTDTFNFYDRRRNRREWIGNWVWLPRRAEKIATSTTTEADGDPDVGLADDLSYRMVRPRMYDPNFFGDSPSVFEKKQREPLNQSATPSEPRQALQSGERVGLGAAPVQVEHNGAASYRCSQPELLPKEFIPTQGSEKSGNATERDKSPATETGLRVWASDTEGRLQPHAGDRAAVRELPASEAESIKEAKSPMRLLDLAPYTIITPHKSYDTATADLSTPGQLGSKVEGPSSPTTLLPESRIAIERLLSTEDAAKVTPNRSTKQFIRALVRKKPAMRPGMPATSTGGLSRTALRQVSDVAKKMADGDLHENPGIDEELWRALQDKLNL